jgi:DNA-binding GntR family transcriptional regulator
MPSTTDKLAAIPKEQPSGPLYKRVVEALRRQILDGTYPVGSQLPTEAELCETHGVSRHTVREALRQLREDGLVSSRQGSGSIVTGAASPRAFVHELDSISDLIQYAASMTFRVDSSESLKVDEELAARLQTQPGTKWLRLEGFRYATSDGGLVCMTVVYVPAAFSGIARLVGHTGGAVYEMIEALYGVRIAEVEQTVHARPAPPGVGPPLGVEPSGTVVEVIRIYRLTSGETAEVAVNLYPPKRFSMTMKLRSRAA